MVFNCTCFGIHVETADQRAGAQTIDALVAEFPEAWNRHDMTAWGQLYSENADFVNIFGEWSKGREQITQEHADLHKTLFRTSELIIQSTNVRMLRPDIAIMHLLLAPH